MAPHHKHPPCPTCTATSLLHANRPLPPTPAPPAPPEVNYIGPGKRPMSSMSPSMLLQGGALRMVVGASNGPRIITGIMQTVLRWAIRGWASRG